MSREAAALVAFGQRVQKERAKRGWTLRHLAAAAGLPLARVHRIEGGATREVTAEDAIRLADAFGVPIAWLVQGSQVKSRVLAAARTQVEDNVDDALDAVLPVLELAAQLDDLDTTPPRPSTGGTHPRGRTSPRSWGQQQADRLRAEWGVPTGPVRDLARLIEDRAGAMVVVAPLPKGVDGLTLTDPDTGTVLLAVGTTRNWERQRFTLAHELGHLIAGDRVIEAVTQDSTSPTETAAHEFARNFLVPTSDLRTHHEARTEPWDELSVAALAWDYQVSPAVLAIQLVRARLAPDSLVTRVSRVSADTWSSLGGWAPERESLAAAADTRRVPPHLIERAIHAWQRGLIPSATIARVHDEDPNVVNQRLLELGLEQHDDLLVASAR